MLELPEARTLAVQVTKECGGRRVVSAVAGASPHRFAFYTGDPGTYGERLAGREVAGAAAYGPLLELDLGDLRLVCGDGASPRLLEPGQPRPAKHQLLVELDDGAALMWTIAMYGRLSLCPVEVEDDDYYRQRAHEAPSPLGPGFTRDHFGGLVAAAKPSLSAKALLATEQRIPGLGNGCLQDILFAAHVHPKAKVADLSTGELDQLYQQVVAVLRSMSDAGGRDTEKNLFGEPGGYRTVLSAKTWKAGCPVCGGPITRAAYLGGNVYFCARCQPLGQ